MQYDNIILSKIIYIRDRTINRQSSDLDLSSESSNKWFRCKKTLGQIISQQKSTIVSKVKVRKHLINDNLVIKDF